MVRVFPIIAVLLTVSGPVPAGPDPTEKVRSLVAAGKTAEAARLLGARLAKAQKKNDLLAEQRAWELARQLLAKGDARTVWAELMAPLDARRGGAFVAAHLLAERLVHACVTHGDTIHLEGAVAALATRATQKDSGRHVALVLRLARAVAANGKGAAAVCSEAAKQGWPELAGMAAIAAFQGSAAGDGDAKRAADSVVEAMIRADDSALAIAWSQPIKNRLATNQVAAGAVARVMQKIGRVLVQPIGGATATPGGAKSSLRKSWRRLRRSKAIATLSRAADGNTLRLEHGFEKHTQTLAVRPGLKLHHHGGLHLALSRAGVAVRRLDLDRSTAAADDAEEPGVFDLVHRLAPGETWVLRKTGVHIR